MLYLIATPIGNLADLSFRAIETLKNCSYVLCEDTRHSRHLLDHYNVSTSLKSFHKFNESKREADIIGDLKEGKEIALISDAGTPAICDPGARLVEACRKEDIPVTIIPGPCALICALTLTGWQRERFQFLGFLPKGEKQLKEVLGSALAYQGISIAYETAQRLLKTLTTLTSLDPTRTIAVVRELTKRHEEYKSASTEELLRFYTEHLPRGEVVLLIDEAPFKTAVMNEDEIASQVKTLAMERKIPLSEAIRQVALKTGFSRKKIYEIVHRIDKSEEK